MGLSELSTFQGDMVLARAAVAENNPMVVSATSLIVLERLAEVGARWFQAYLPGDEARIDAIGRVTDAGYDTLVHGRRAGTVKPEE